MNRKPVRACYRHAPISRVSTLARVLGLREIELYRLVEQANSSYVPGPTMTKADGSPRYTYQALPPLRNAQDKLKIRVLREVEFPEYLQGAIRDRARPRSYIRNAEMHSGAQFVLKADITNFFPSITSELTATIWTDFFRFPDEVARCLTALVTKDGFVAQGLVTSTYIANLVFWDVEPRLYLRLESRGLTYSRYIDDVTVSAHGPFTANTKFDAVSQVIGMFASKGFKTKRSKLKINSASTRMSVHNLIVNRGTSIAPGKKSQLRSAVKQIELRYTNEMKEEKYHKDWCIVASRLGQARRFHQQLAEKLRARLDRVRPTA